MEIDKVGLGFKVGEVCMFQFVVNVDHCDGARVLSILIALLLSWQIYHFPWK